MKKKLSICESLLCLDLVIFLVLNGIKPQAPLLVVPFRQPLHVSGLRLSFLINENNSSRMCSKWFTYDKSKNSTCDNSTRTPSHFPIHHDLRKHKPTTQATCPIFWVRANVLIHHTRLSEILEVPYSKVSERRSQDEVQIQSVMVRILVYCSFLSPHRVRIK